MLNKLPRAPIALLGLLTLQSLLSSCASGTQAPAAQGNREARPAQATPAAASNQAPAQPTEPLQHGYNLLSESIREGLTGLALEPQASRDKVRSQARAFASLRNRRLTAAERKRRVEACEQDGARDAQEEVFCRLTLKALGASHRARKHRAGPAARGSRSAVAARILKAIRRGEFREVASASDSQVIDALKKVRNVSELRPLIDRAVSAKDKGSCMPTSLLTGLGLKAEENFPDPEYKSLSKALYQRATECGTDSAAVKGTYRLGLLQVWDQECDQAEAAFAKIADNPEAADFRSRVTYWRYYCAKQTGNAALRDSLKAALVKDYPMSLHGLITADPKALAEKPPQVAFRSSRKPALNAAVRVAEALQAEGAREASIDALAPALEELKGAEPEFQLYVGLLFTRAGDTLNKFKLLSGLFRDYPGIIARESLEMLFPLQRFEIVRHYENQADPYLVISLIRQESAFNERARSRVGAMGLMQLMPQTARRMERVSKRELYDPKVNIRLGVRFFSHLLNDRYGGEVEHALAAYNAGPDKVDVWKARYPVDNRLLFVDLIPFRETREYVASIARNYYYYKSLYSADEKVAASTTAPVPGRAPASAVEKPRSPSWAASPFKLADS